MVVTMPILINIQRSLKTGLVKTRTGKIFPVTIEGKLLRRVNVNDTVKLKKSPISGDWIITGVIR